MQDDCCDVGHRGCWKDQGSFFVEHLGDSFLKLYGGEIVEGVQVSVIPQLSLAHGFEHGFWAFGEDIASEIDGDGFFMRLKHGRYYKW